MAGKAGNWKKEIGFHAHDNMGNAQNNIKKAVENLGFVDDIVKVKPGFGRNYLIPNQLAVFATSSEKKILQETRNAPFVFSNFSIYIFSFKKC